MRQKIRSSFRLQFSLTVILVILIPVMIILTFIAYRGYQAIETNAKGALANQSSSLAQSAAIFEETAQLALDNMRRQPAIKSMDPESQKPVLISATDVYTSLYLALTTDLSGTSLARSDDETSKEYGDRAWFREASSGYEGFRQSLVSRTTGQPAIVYASPIEQDDEIVGVAFIGTELTQLAEAVGAIKIGDTGLGYLVDSEGFMIAHPDPFYSSDNNLVFVGTYPPVAQGESGASGFYSFTDEDGVEWLADIQPVGNGWYAIVQQHRSEALAAVSSFLVVAIGLLLLSTAVIGFLTYVVAGRAVKPIEYLTSAAKSVSAGYLNKTVEVDRVDEIGTLAVAFNSMTLQLRDLVSNLETRIAARTQDLNLAANIGRQVSQARNLDDVLTEATTAMKDQFGLYQVQVYLTDPRKENLILRASDGFAGSRLLEAGHQLPIDEESLNGSTAYNKQAVIVADTHKNKKFRPHPLLPDTRSEMVVPLILDEDVLGVIDLQSTEANSLTEDVLPAFTVLAGQLAIAILNARQNRAAQENQRLMRTIIDASPDWIFVKNHEHRYQLVNQAYANAFHISPEEFVGKNDLDLGFPEEIVKGNPEKGIRGFWADDREIMDSGQTKLIPEEPGEVDGQAVILQTVKAPLMDAEGDVTGIVGFVHDITNRKQAEETIAKRADELQAVAELSTAVAATSDPQQLLQKAVNLAKERFGLYHAHIYLMDEEKGNLVLTAGAGEAGRIMGDEGISIPLSQEQSLVARAARKKEGVIVNDVMADPGFLPNPLLPNTRSEMAVPMIANNELLGVLDVQSDIIDGFSNQDIQIQTTLASQTAVALQNARQYNTLQRSQESIRERETLLRTIIDSTPDWIFVKDSNHCYLMVNQGYADSLHMSPDDFIGKNDLDIGFPEDIVKGNPEKGIRGFWADDREIMERGELVVIDMEPAVIDGEERFLNTIKAPLQDSAGNVVGIVGFVHDITNRILSEELTRERESLLRTIVDASPDWIFVKNKEHRYQLVNKAYADSFHLSSEQFIGQNDLELGFPEDIVKGNPEKGIRGFWPDDDDVMASKQMKEIPEEPAEVDGKPVVLRTIKAPLIDAEGNAAGIVGFVQDITAQKETQREQERLTQEFEEQLNQMNALQRAMTREGWTVFLSNMGREGKGFSFSSDEILQPFDKNSIGDALGNLPYDINEVDEISYNPTQTAVTLPLQLHGESIGVIGARTVNGDPINAEQQALLTTLTAQVAESLDRARLFEETEIARSQTEALFTGSENVVRSTSLDGILLSLVQATALKNMHRASLLFFDQPWQDTPPESISVAATWRVDDSITSVDIGTTYPFDMFPGIQFLDRETPSFIDDVLTNPRIDENSRQLFSEGLGMRSVIIVPLVAGDQWIGFVLGLSSKVYHMDESDIRQITSLAGQAATVAQSQRLYQEATNKAEYEQILRQVSDRVYAAPDAETVLRTAAREIGQALGLETFIYLEDPEDEKSLSSTEMQKIES